MKGKGSLLTQFPAKVLCECSSLWLSQVHGARLDWMGGWAKGTCDLPRDLLTRTECVRAEPGICCSGPQPTVPSLLST